MGAGLNVIIFDDLEWPLTRVYFQVEYLNNGATLLNSTTLNTIIDHQGLYRKRAKTGVVDENFAQEGQKFSCLRTIGLYGEGSFGGGGVDDTLARGH